MKPIRVQLIMTQEQGGHEVSRSSTVLETSIKLDRETYQRVLSVVRAQLTKNMPTSPLDYRKHCPNPLCGSPLIRTARSEWTNCPDCCLNLAQEAFSALQDLQEAHMLLARQYELCLKRDPTNVVVGLAACIATLDQAANMADEYREKCLKSSHAAGSVPSRSIQERGREDQTDQDE